MYAGANRSSLPSWTGWHTYPEGLGGEDEPGPGWTELLAPFFVPPDSPMYNCPSFASWVPEEPRRNYFLAAQWAGRSGRHATKLTDVKMTSRFVLSGGCTQAGLYPPTFGTNPNAHDDADRDDFGANCLSFLGNEHGFLMHPGGNNVLFDDGHVQVYREFDAASMTFHPSKMQAWEDVTPE